MVIQTLFTCMKILGHWSSLRTHKTRLGGHELPDLGQGGPRSWRHSH